MYRIINLPKIIDCRGNLTFLESFNQIPFKIERVFWTYDVPGGESRGGHAFINQSEIIIALSGSFDVVIMDKSGEKKIIHLNRSYYGLFLPPLTWRHIENFSTNSIGLHLSNKLFDDKDYIRDLEQYLNIDQ